MQIVGLEIQNFKRIRAVSLSPADPVTEVRGRNAQGKSSVLDAVEAALCGAARCPDQPVRAGERSATVRCDLGEFVVTRKWEPTGSTLTVRGAGGEKIAKPQTVLDSLFAGISFDPLRFVLAEAKSQASQLRDLIGLKTDDLDDARQRCYTERAAVNATTKRDEASLYNLPTFPADAPAEDVSVDDLLSRSRAARQTIKANDAARQSTAKRRKEHDGATGSLTALVEDLRQRLAEAETALANHTAPERIQALESAEAESAALVDPDADAIDKQIAEAGQHNNAAAAVRQRRALEAIVEQSKKAAASLTDRMAELDREKADRIGAAKYPVAGLGFDAESGSVTYRGVPLSQASGAEKIRVGLGICTAMNPTLRTVLIRDGSLLDDDAMRGLREWAAESDFQVFIERVGTESGDGAIVIEDGRVEP